MLIVSLGLALAGAISLWLSRWITRPVLELTKSAQDVQRNKDYSLRVERRSNDELGVLVKRLQ